MRIVSKDELNRMKKGGVKVKRRLGTKSLEPDAEDGASLSGESTSKAPAPALTPPAPTPDTQPMASMSASMQYRDTLLETLIQNNTAAIEGFRQALLAQKPRVGVSYRHKVIRDKKSSLIDEVISTPANL